MLTSSANQYLRPEYLTPLPTTLDAKKSPLALLAQTCSQIGVDPPTGKSLLTPLDKSSKSSKSSSDSSTRDKNSPSTNGPSAFSSSSETTKSSSFKPYESCVTSDSKSASPEQQRVPSAHSSTPGSSSRSRTPGNKRCSSNQSASSGGGRAMTPQGRKSTTPGSSDAPTRESPGSRMTNGEAATSRSGSTNSPSLSSAKSASYSPAVFSSQDLSLSGFRPAALNMIASTSGSATTTTTPSAAAYGLSYPPQMTPMDAMTASSLMSQHHAALKNGLAGHAYLSYARMKTPTGADTLVPVCRDPYCSSCQLNSHLLAATSQASSVSGAKIPTSQAATACPAGCAQCDHKPSQAAAAAAASSPYAAYAHAHLVALAAASQMPYVCNWIGSDAAYCGKRFTSSDELLQHFRSHTAGGDQAAANAATTAAALSLLTPPGLVPGHPLLSRTYPTPPLSPLATARYHPYGKPYGAPALSPLGLPLPPPHAHPAAAGLPPYFSPYSAALYANSRLASSMHP